MPFTVMGLPTHAPEIQYLKASTSGEQCREFGRLVEATVSQTEGGYFAFHSGIRLTGSHLGLRLNDK
jgi:hypothetical protein